MTPQQHLDEFQRQYALSRRWTEIQQEAYPFKKNEYQWWDWYYYVQWNWRSMTKAEATIVYPEVKEKRRAS